MKICEHIKDNGSTCGSPALTGYDYCYFHQRLRHPRHRPSDFEYKLPILDTPESILMATQHITQAALDGLLEDRRARLVLSALRLAKSMLKETNKEKEKQEKEKNNVELGMNHVGIGISNVGTGAPARATRAQLAVSNADSTKTAPCTNALHNVDTGFQARVSVASATEEADLSSDSVASPKKPPQSAPLSAHQLKLMKKIIRRGPSHPQFKLAARLLDHHIADRSSA